MTFTIKLADAPGTEALALESARTGWRELELRTQATDTTGNTTLLGIGPPQHGAVTSPYDPANVSKIELVAVRQHGPHYEPIEWRPEQPIALTDGMTLPPIPERLRISAWTPAVALIAKNGKGQATFDAGNRLTIDPRILASPCTGLDDVSIVNTVFLTGKILGASPALEVGWADDFPGMELIDIIKKNSALRLDDIRTDLLEKTIAAFHAKRVQVFAGFYVDTGNTVKLGSSPAQEAVTKANAARLIELVGNSKWSMREFAQKLVGFFDDKQLEIDGIWFDFEVAAFPRGLADTDEPRIRDLLYEVALAFGKEGRYVAFASANDQSAHDTGTPAHPPAAPSMLGHFFSHPSSLARMPNVITRPMSYDSGRFNTVRQCYGHYGVLPQNLQIAVGLGNGKPNVDAEMKNSAAQIRQNRCGLIHWAFRSANNLKAYEAADAIMNAGAPPHGTFGQPIQGPLNRKRLQVMRDAGATVVIPDDAP